MNSSVIAPADHLHDAGGAKSEEEAEKNVHGVHAQQVPHEAGHHDRPLKRLKPMKYAISPRTHTIGIH